MTHGSPTGTDATGAHSAGTRAAARPTPFDLVASTIVLSGASAAWFIWGRADAIVQLPLLLAAAVSLATLVVAIVRIRAARGPSTMAVDPHARRMYWIGTGAEIVAIPLVAVALARAGLQELLTAAVLAIVALHFIPLAIAFKLVDLWWVTAASLAVAAASLWVFLAGHDGARALAGGLGGFVMLTAAWMFLVRARSRRDSR